MKWPVAGAVFVSTLLIGSAAYAGSAQTFIGNPYSDTVNLWSEIAASIDLGAHEVAVIFQQTIQSQAQTAAVANLAQSEHASVEVVAPTNTTTQITATSTIQSTSTHPISLTQALIEYPSSNQSALASKLDSLVQIVGNLAALFSTSEAQQATAVLPQNVAANGNPANPYAAANDINNLSDVTISNPSIIGLSAGDIPDLSGEYLSLNGGTVSGNVSLTGALGIGTTSSQDAFALNGSAYFANVAAPATTTNRLYANGNNLYWAGNVISGAATGNWASDGTNAWRTTGNIGIGTTSPFTSLSVVGNGYLTGSLSANSLSLNSPLSITNGGTGWSSIANGYIPFGSGASALATSTNLYWDNIDGRLGVGTTSPYSTLSVAGQIVAQNFVGTSTTVNSTLPILNSIVYCQSFASACYSALPLSGGRWSCLHRRHIRFHRHSTSAIPT